MPAEQKAHPFYGWLCVAIGLWPILLATEALELADVEVNAPNWVMLLVGLVFVLAGFMILAGQKSRVTSFCAILLCASFGATGAWVALAAPGEGFSGGIPFAPQEFNIMLARWVFGVGAVISFLIAGLAVREFRKG